MKGQEQLTQTISLLNADLNANNYTDKFSLLLHCEQWTEEQDVRYFNMAEVEMKVDQGTIFCDTGITGIAGVETQSCDQIFVFL